MSESSENARKEYRAELESECAALSTILNANRRPRVYRHHRFFRRTRHVMALAKKSLAGARKAERTKRVVASLLALQRCIVRAVEDCTAELAANRIDTAAISLACVSVLSRLGCCVARVVVATTSRAFALRVWPAALVDYVASPLRTAAQPRTPPPAPRRGFQEAAPRNSYGGVLNAVLRKAASKKH